MSIHQHRCVTCGTNVECDGELERNHDGWPDVICREFREACDGRRPAFRCETCAEQNRLQAVRDLLENV